VRKGLVLPMSTRCRPEAKINKNFGSNGRKEKETKLGRNTNKFCASR
jgi:hypothetical protein